MRIPVVVSATLVLGLVVLPLPSLAQEQGGLGLDLSDAASQATPAQDAPGEVGLDLRGDAPRGSELLPRFVLVGLETPERAGAQQSARWLQALGRGALGSGMVSLGASLSEVKERLADRYDAAVRCSTATCLAEPADTLDVDLLVTARLSLEDAGWTLRAWTYDHDRNVVHEDVVTGRNPKDAAFQKEAAAKLSSRMMAVARPRAVLKVAVNVPQAVVRAGERTLGVGSVEARLPPGPVQLEVSADEYSTFTQALTLKPGETQEVTANLEISGPAPDGPGDDPVAVAKKKKGPSGPSIFSRPALYTTLVGLAVVGVGVMMGSKAKDVESRARDADGDGVIDITPREREDARSQSNLATALVAGGGAVAAGSVLWLVLVPAKRPAPAASVAPVKTAGASTSLNLVVGGSF